MGKDDLLVVGLGASAGGVSALKTFFAHVPADSGVAYVAILHLSPDHESRLADVLQASASIPVSQVRGEVRVQPNHVYVIPPNHSLSMRDSRLAPEDVSRIEQRRAPIDLFFRTLADSHGSRAVCIVLSGTGSDGAAGLKRVKEEGGLCLAQSPEEAQYGEMPSAARATGLLDQVLPVAEMPARIVAYRQHLRQAALREEEADPDGPDERALRDLLAQLRSRTGHDFTTYKRGTVLRRIARRLSVHAIPDLAGYAKLVRERPEELQALLKDLLISVTSFFRDADAFAALERVLVPRLLDGKRDQDQVRAWIPGCATGEEAYSIAMLLTECAGAGPASPAVQLFASDIDERAVAVAREGLYTSHDVANVSQERLRRFFSQEGERYRVRRELRELVLFAHHNILRDPPFGRLDFASCRNLLIYLDRPAQRRVMQALHFALNPGGYLFLGGSETIDEASEFFVPIDRDAHVYQSRGSGRHRLPLAGVAGRPPRMPPRQDAPAESPVRDRLSIAEVHQRLVEQYAPPSVVVNESHEIVHLSDRVGRYLQLAGGEPSHNLLKVVRPELQPDLRSALYQAARQRTTVEAAGVQVRIDERTVAVDIIVRPVLREDDPARGFLLVLFREVAGDAPAERPAAVQTGDSFLRLEEEVARVRAQLRATTEGHETQAEELKASNEELQAMNEELRSSAEELETSREELQSANEELQTVNQELQIKIDELTQASNDILNLINSTEIGTVFLDRGGRLKLFTPAARPIFSLIPSDRGRPLSDITSQLVDLDLTPVVGRVLNRLERVEREVRTRDGRWYLMHALPYRTAEDRIDGVVLTFLDITRRKEAEERLRVSEQRLRLMMESATDYAILTIDREGRIDTWNAGAARLFGYTPEEAVGRSVDLLFTHEDVEQGVPTRAMGEARNAGRAVDERWHVRKDGTRFFVSGVTTALRDPGGGLVGYITIARDLTERREWEDALQAARETLETRVRERTGELEAAREWLDRELAERRQTETHVRTLLTRLITIQEDERRRIGRDLHDHLGQQMTALRLKLEALSEMVPGARGGIDEVRQIFTRLDHDLDFLAWELRPAALDDLGLATTLGNFIREWSANYGVPADFHTHKLDDQRLGVDIETNLYRIAQEALNNVHKHARAGHVAVILERRGGEIVLIVEDDGVGFDAAAPAGPRPADARLGLIGMRERAAVVGGALEIETEPGQGTTVFVRVPLTGAAPRG